MPATQPITRLAAAALLAFAAGQPCTAQQSDTTRCRTVLNRATHDSALVRIGLAVTSFDSASKISPLYRELFVQALRQQLKVPRPLPIDVYGFFTPTNAQGQISGNSTVVPVVAGDYRAALKRDGHLSNIRVVGGARTKAFDDAMLAALRTVGDSQSAPPFVEDMKADSIELRLSVRLITASMTRPGEVKVPDAPLEPLFAMRVPEYGFPSSVVRADPGNPRPRYPGLARMAKADGSVVAEYIVTADGGADIRSLQFLTATALPFVDAVLEVLPQYRYIPLAISGCPVASLVRMPFTFEIIR